MAPSSYRPISFLNTICKLHASLLAERLKSILDPHLGPTHYGFRERRSTSQAFFLVQRTFDFLEAGQTNGGVLFLDWEKAFGKVKRGPMVIALRRAGTPPALLDATAALYRETKFRVVYEGRESDERI